MNHIFGRSKSKGDEMIIKCCRRKGTPRDEEHAVCLCVKQARFKHYEYKQQGSLRGTPMLAKLKNLMRCLAKVSERFNPA